MSHVPVTRFLRTVYLADAAVSAVTALLMLAGGSALHELLQLPAWLMLSGGAMLLPYAGLVGWMSSRASLPRPLLWAVIGINLLWAVDCAVIAFGGWLVPSAFGLAFLAVNIVTVVVVAELQYVGLRRASLRAGSPAYA